MKKMKKVIAGVAAVAALIAVPTASAMASTDTGLPTWLEVDGCEFDMDSATADCTTTDFASVDVSNIAGDWDTDKYTAMPTTTTSADGSTYTVTIQMIQNGTSTSDKDYVATYTLREPSSEAYFSSLNVDNYEVDLDEAQTTDGAGYGYVIEVDDPSAINPGLISAGGTYSSYMYDWSHSENGGIYTYRYYAIAEDGTYTNIYVVTFVQAPRFSSLNVDYNEIDLDAALTDDGYTICVDDPSAINPELISAGGKYASTFYDKSISADGSTYTYRYYAVSEDNLVRSDPYTVVFTSNCSTDAGIELAGLTASGIYVELNGTEGTVESNMCPENRNFESVSANLPDGYTIDYAGQEGETFDDTVVVTYALKSGDETVETYTVTFTFVDQQSCSTDTGDEFTLAGMIASGIYVELDGTEGTVESNMCPENRDFQTVSADNLPNGYTLEYVDQEGEDSDDTVVVTYALKSGDETVETYTVTFTFVDQQSCSTDAGEEGTDEGETGEGDDTTDENEGDDTEDTDEESSEEAASSEEASEEETESESGSLATTGSVLAGVGVFALLALLGSAVVFVVRKRV